MSAPPKYQGWIRSGIFGGLQKLSVPISGVLITMILAHKALTVPEMGEWGIFMSVTSIVEMFRQSLVKTSLIKYINYSEAHHHKFVLSAAMLLNVCITLLISLVIFIFRYFIANFENAPHFVSMLDLFQIGLLIMIPFSHFEWLMYGKVQFKGLFWTYVVRQGLSLLLVVILFLWRQKISLNALVITYDAGLLAGTFVAYYYVKPYLTGTFTHKGEWTKKLWNFGKVVFGSGISTLVYRNAEQMMLSPILGNTTFSAFQNVGSRVINLLDIPSQTLGDILFPKSASRENSDRPGMIKYFYEKTVGASLCFILPVVFVIFFFPQLLIIILFGSQYYNAIPYLKLIAPTAIFLAYLKQYGVIIDSTGRPKVNFVTITLIGFVHVVFCYFFIKRFGLMGAGYALLCSHTFGFILTQCLLYKYFKINFLNSFKHAFKFYPEIFKLITERVSMKWKMQ